MYVWKKYFLPQDAEVSIIFLPLLILSSPTVVRAVPLSNIEGGVAGGQRLPQGLRED
jgi:hypothetical protein